VTLLAFAADRRAVAQLLPAPAMQQSIDISCPPGAQQQSKPSATECGGRMMGETDRQRDACSLHRSCYDTRSSICYFDVRLKANMSQLNLPHGTDN